MPSGVRLRMGMSEASRARLAGVRLIASACRLESSSQMAEVTAVYSR